MPWRQAPSHTVGEDETGTTYLQAISISINTHTTHNPGLYSWEPMGAEVLPQRQL